MYGLILLNTVQLIMAFNDGSKQEEKFNSELIERIDIGPQYFSENKFEIAFLTIKEIPEEIGRVVAY